MDGRPAKERGSGNASDRGLQPQAPAISLPKGGGAIRGIDEKFSVNPVTGTASLSVPIFATPGRSDFYPKLSLDHDSGVGNGPFGLSWNLSIPSISRKTDKGLPRYRDAEESDTYILSGAEDLVPALEEDDEGKWERVVLTHTVKEEDPSTEDGVQDVEYTVYRYRPRIEGLFARIERWVNKATGDVHWRSISKDNVTTIYGKDPECRIVDPDDNRHVFKWLIEQTHDDKGNIIVYEYEQENDKGVDSSLLHEKNRLALQKSYANRYLKRIKYASRTSYLLTSPSLPTDWLMEVVFDYGDEVDFPPAEYQSPAATDQDTTWPVRPDAFSTYRAGFEIRTQRLCRRVLMLHHFQEELGIDPCLVRATEFTYDENPVATYLTAVSQRGYRRDTEKQEYVHRVLPPLEFSYRKPEIDESVHEPDTESLENLPIGLDGDQYQWVDLDGEGINGILTEQGEAWLYKRNLGNGNFGPLKRVKERPSLGGLRTGQAQFMDLAADGRKDVVTLEAPESGFHERTKQASWTPFSPFVAAPEINWRDPNLRLVDLTGDGHADILITHDTVFTWYLSQGEAGFAPAKSVARQLDEELGPSIVFADATQSIYLADMSGDGLSDIVRIKNNEVCYWPNLGYGRFGAKVTMGAAPWFDFPDQFDQRRIRLADIDGSGTTDIIYLGRGKITFWPNQAGNSWGAPYELTTLPRIDNLTSVSAVDLLGNGTACIVWSSPLPGDRSQPMRYIDLMGGKKPHLLSAVVNNMGAETRLQYKSSTEFYLKDAKAGNPWITKLPFPVHVVERVETREMITGTKLVTLYKYHHGYFDGDDREFRGFGMVEQWDTESFDQFNQRGSFDTLPSVTEEGLHLPPVHTKTWFHTGVYKNRAHISDQYQTEYFKDDPHAAFLHDTVLPSDIDLSAREEHEACRALKGQILRQEIYADDDSSKSTIPYSVTERNYDLVRIQPRAGNRHAVFFAHPRATLDYHYERDPQDPRVSHQLTLEVDRYGNVQKVAAIAYPRRLTAGAEHPEQQQTLITCTENDFFNSPVEEEENPDIYPEFYRVGVPIETRSYELTGLPATPDNRPYSFDDLLEYVNAAQSIEYHQQPNLDQPQKRLIEHVRSLYLADDLSQCLALRKVDSLALPCETYKKAFTPELAEDVYGDDSDDVASLLIEGRYKDWDGAWWVPSGRAYFSADPQNPDADFARAHFYLPQWFEDPFGSRSSVTYDDHDLLIKETQDALANIVQAENNYRTLQPELVIDPNGNRSRVAFDALGMVVGTAVMGKDPDEYNIEPEGDSLEGFEPDLDPEVLKAHIDNPLVEDPHAILQQATTRLVYDPWRYRHSRDAGEPVQPVVVYTLAREIHESKLEGGEQIRVQHSFLYSDGLGREIQTKIQAEPGPVDEVFVENRWVGTGWTLFNNKGKPVRQFEPFFSPTHTFECTIEGVSSTLFYDPLERVVATLHPNHSYEKVVSGPWSQETWDVNDTLGTSSTDPLDNPADDPDVGYFLFRLDEDAYLPTWYQQRIQGDYGEAGRRAAEKALQHAATPTTAHLNTLGRTFLTIALNNLLNDQGEPQQHPTRITLDVEGNTREVRDADTRQDPEGRLIMSYQYDMLGRQLGQDSADAGKRLALANVAGNPIQTWDAEGHKLRYSYDPLQRPVSLWVRVGEGEERLVEHTVYGESLPDHEAKQKNLRGNIHREYDGAGLISHELFDFKGNLLTSCRWLLSDWSGEVDWSPLDRLESVEEIQNAAVPFLEEESFVSRTEYDALNRPTRQLTPDGSITVPAYNRANLLETVDVSLPGADERRFVTSIGYNAKGQRTEIQYGNGVGTTYDYDTDTFRLLRLRTNRGGNNGPLQDLRYAYDPVGNITEIRDDAWQTVFYDNSAIDAVMHYRYDALYRLIEATGREHESMTACPYRHGDKKQTELLQLTQPKTNAQALRNYTEHYSYDLNGNLEEIHHTAGANGWTREQTYEETNNRILTSHAVCDDGLSFEFSHDANGNIDALPHLQKMRWDHADRLIEVGLDLNGRRAYYAYDAGGQRVRKVIDNGTSHEERIYLGGYEIYRKNLNGDRVFERQTLHVMYDQRRIALVETRTLDRRNTKPGQPERLYRYQLENHLGSSAMELDETTDANIISYEEYYPYGGTAYLCGINEVETNRKRYRYTGKERDDETGLYYYGARYYVPWIGRWLSCDPSELLGGINEYLYVKGNPVAYIDKEGLRESKEQQFVSYTLPPDLYHELGIPTLPFDYEFMSLEEMHSYVESHPLFGEEEAQEEVEIEFPPLDAVIASAIATFIFDIPSVFFMGGPEAAQEVMQVRENIRIWIYGSQKAAERGQGLESVFYTALALLPIGIKAPGVQNVRNVRIRPSTIVQEPPLHPAVWSRINPGNRPPILPDADLLINAMEGSIHSLKELRAGTTYLTPYQLSEFLNVETEAQIVSRLRFLKQEGILSLGTKISDQIMSSQAFKQLFRPIYAAQGTGDAILASFGKLTGYEVVTAERVLTNFLTQTRPQLGINIRRVLK